MMKHTTGGNDVLKPRKDNELLAVKEFLKDKIATQTEVAVALNIYRPNLCRRKRTLEKAGELAVVKKGICPITKHKAGFITTNKELFPKTNQLELFPKTNP